MFLLPLFLGGVASVGAVSPLAGVNIAGFDFGVEITGTANLQNAQGPLMVLGNSDGAGQMQHFAKNDGLNLFRLPVSWQFLINSSEFAGSGSGSSNATNGPFNNGTMGPSNNSTRGPFTNSTMMPGNGTTRGNRTPASNAATGTLDATNFAEYDMLVQACLATGATCVIDIHNYARFNNKVIGQGGPSNADFANLWSQIGTKYAKEAKIIFGIMNEPHDIPDLSLWAATVQEAVTAIRAAGATTQRILLPGTDFTSAQTFISNGSAGNLSTVKNPDGSLEGLIFDVHKYLDVDNSGTHRECVSDHVNDTFMPLGAFLKKNNRMAMLSETGGGNTTSCLRDLCATLKFINNNPDVYLGYAGWAAGGFSPETYELTMTPRGSNGNFVDQDIVKQCVVETRGVASNATANGALSGAAADPGNSKAFQSAGTKGMAPASGSGLVLGVMMLRVFSIL
ncbi:uncharacterized protein BP5553_09107 [Venustampulla echinocandica]|uniref:cellulase n=1 Tax=Venustampulla echinocandica TaxID=2656787 RepID=A0A370TE01_9HELO|nr:uncharacterized protein BP5553_09107 [Venustampulla echinocandica]RDL32651.1 hypothetical protein BP5553_09107 [Venustampulla echinocandica]